MNPNDLTRDGLRIMPDVMPTDPVLAAHLALYGWAIARLTPHALVVVDWGCGAGYCASMLASGVQYVGVDRDHEVLAYARERYGRPGDRYVQADLEDELPDVPIGAVGFCFEVLEHLSSLPRVNAARLLTRTRCLFASVPYLEQPNLNPHHSHTQLHESSFAAMTAHATFGFNDVGHVGSGKNLTLIIEASDAA